MKLASSKRTALISKTERYTDTLKQALKGKDKRPNTKAYGRKSRERKRLYTNACGKERKNKPQMPRAKKERKTKPQTMVANEKWLP